MIFKLFTISSYYSKLFNVILLKHFIKLTLHALREGIWFVEINLKWLYLIWEQTQGEFNTANAYLWPYINQSSPPGTPNFITKTKHRRFRKDWDSQGWVHGLILVPGILYTVLLTENMLRLREHKAVPIWFFKRVSHDKWRLHWASVMASVFSTISAISGVWLLGFIY